MKKHSIDPYNSDPYNGDAVEKTMAIQSDIVIVCFVLALCVIMVLIVKKIIDRSDSFNQSSAETSSYAGQEVEGTAVSIAGVTSTENTATTDQNADASISAGIVTENRITELSLQSLQPYSTGAWGLYHYNSVTDTIGRSYEYVLYGNQGPVNGRNRTLPVSEAYESYFIDGEYQWFTASVAVFDTGNATGYIEIYGDDNLLWSDYHITKETLPYDIKVDVSGVSVLRILIMEDSIFEGIGIGLGNPELIVGEGKTTDYKPNSGNLAVHNTTLAYMAPYSKGDVSFFNDVFQIDTFGNMHRYALIYSSFSTWYNGADSSYYLDGNYKTFTGTVTVFEDNKGTEHLEIYGDGVLLWSADVTKDTSPFDINVDVTGVKALKIHVTDVDGYYALSVGFGNPMLLTE